MATLLLIFSFWFHTIFPSLYLHQRPPTDWTYLYNFLVRRGNRTEWTNNVQIYKIFRSLQFKMDASYSARKWTKLDPYNFMGRTGYTTNRSTVHNNRYYWFCVKTTSRKLARGRLFEFSLDTAARAATLNTVFSLQIQRHWSCCRNFRIWSWQDNLIVLCSGNRGVYFVWEFLYLPQFFLKPSTIKNFLPSGPIFADIFTSVWHFRGQRLEGKRVERLQAQRVER